METDSVGRKKMEWLGRGKEGAWEDMISRGRADEMIDE